MMLSDHPLGVGANQFAVIGNVEHYYESAGVQIYASALAGNVHNLYYLTAAETGYPGLVAALIASYRPFIVAFRCGWQNSGDYRGDLLLRLGGGAVGGVFSFLGRMGSRSFSVAVFACDYDRIGGGQRATTRVLATTTALYSRTTVEAAIGSYGLVSEINAHQ